MVRTVWLILIAVAIALPSAALAQRKDKKQGDEEKKQHFFDSVSVAGLKFRAIGPALTSGRISDFAMVPGNEKVYYIATASGGVWKTANWGTTFEPIFDGEGSYSIGCVTVDPHNPSVVWVGTGENNNQRSVAYGDGIYRSEDAGKSWKNMGLKNSEHIAKIIVHPDEPDVIYAAAQGPLWSAGGDRGVFKSTDGGASWDSVLYVSEHTGVSDLIMDPRDPDVLYAAAHQRRRHVFTYHGGGPESAIYKTTDGGESWKKVNRGLPSGDLGRIGLAISPADPEVLYAIVEATGDKSGFYRSSNRGASWERRSGYVTSGNYYQEIIPDPKDPDVVYVMDTYLHRTTDGGKNFDRINISGKHVDDHCIWIDPKDTDHWLVGCDGGIYETLDGAQSWRYFSNLPVTQFYKVSVDDSEPFYFIYGGTQDNFSMGGPSRSTSGNGIVNADWFMTHGGDGFESQVDPNNPNIVYAQSQYGVLVRYDRMSGEEVPIQPQPRQDEPEYRWNWDAPLHASTHEDGRLYFAANKLFRSDDRGDNWEVISEDLTRDLDRNKLEVMGRTWSVDAVAKHRSTSPYGTIVAFAESPLDEELLYVGTDDGLIQVTEDGGDNWMKVESFPAVPERTYVNALWASQHEENVVYAAFNHHKYGDFNPYIYKSEDRGRSWKSISANLPERGSVYAFAEDHVDPELLFVGTEFGIFFSNDGGAYWKQLKKGVPTIAVRDLAIQKRENDLVLGTFGRGFYVMDDYSSLRNLKPESLAEQKAAIFPVRDALLYEQREPLGRGGKSFQGDNYYMGENLAPSALIYYYIAEDYKSLEQKRKAAEKEAAKEGKNVDVPSYEEYKAEREEEAPQLLFTIKDAEGEVVRKYYKSPSKGLQRLDWDLRFPSTRPMGAPDPGSSGLLVTPGEYSVELALLHNGLSEQLAGPERIRLVPLENSSLPRTDRTRAVAFQRDIAELYRQVRGAQRMLREVEDEIELMQAAAQQVDAPHEALDRELREAKEEARDISYLLNRDPIASELDIEKPPTIGSRIGWLMYNQDEITTEPTQTHRDVYRIARQEFQPLLKQVINLKQETLPALQNRLEELKAPYTRGRIIDEN